MGVFELNEDMLDDKNISSILITHKHADQTLGLFELKPFFWKYKKKINLYADKITLKYLKKTQSYLFSKTIDYKPRAARKQKTLFSQIRNIEDGNQENTWIPVQNSQRAR